ncbi:MAG TPA: hypothetical protein VNS58_27605 [Puia sp.]|nr:hypothetical protein [Puia sp.]
MKPVTFYSFLLPLAFSAMHAFSQPVLREQPASPGQPDLSRRPAPTGQPVYKDQLYRQDYSIKYEILQVKDPAGLRLQKVACDRNGVIQVCSSQGLLRPSGGAFLYPGTLAPDRSYRPIMDKKIKNIGLYEDQFVYVDDKAVLSNSWAGKLYSLHTMPAVTLFAGGPAFSFLLSDGHALQYLKDSQVVWNGTSADSIIDIRFDRRKNSFWILGKSSISVLPIADKQLRVIYKGNNLTCFEPVQDHESILVGTHGGYFVLNAASGAVLGDTYRKLPCTDLSVIRRIDGRTWFGSAQGAFVLREDGKFDYFASRRWLPSDKVADLSAGPRGSVLILTDKGLGQICFKQMTLADKAAYYERQVRERHIRLGFNSTLGRMKDGDLSTGSLEDSDNDGLWTSMYLGAEVFRYAATRSPEALQNCRESLDAMERLYTVNSLRGFPSRSFERRGYASADTQVWKHAAHPEWDWKSTTSSDEAIGHIFVFGAIAELVDDTALRNKAIRLIDALMTHIVEHDMYLIDWNGKPTTWGRWNPEYVNARPKFVGDRKINSSNIIAMLQTAWHFTGKKIYRDKAFELMDKYGYLENLMRPMAQVGMAPADADDLSKHLSENWNHSDDEMYFLGYWGLYRYAFNDTLKEKFKTSILDHWQAERPEKEGAWNVFTAMTGTANFDLDNAVWYLQRYPMDLIEWTIKNSDRKDIVPIAPNFRGQTIAEVLPPDESPTTRHNTNLFDLDRTGRGGAELSAGDTWLLPYWMARYLKIISASENKTLPSHTSTAIYQDSAYEQDYSIRYYPENAGPAGSSHTAPAGPRGTSSLQGTNPGLQDVPDLRTVICDRNDHIQVLSGNSLLSPRAGGLLVPGALVPDRTYLPLLDRKIQAACLVEGQFVYLDDKALFSNAWAGKLYTLHNMPGAHLLSAGASHQFLISDGRQLALLGDSVLWSGPATVISSSAKAKAASASWPVLLDIRYEPANHRFWLLSSGVLSYFSPLNKKVVPVFHGEGLTCFTLWDKKILIGTHNGYIEIALPSFRQTGLAHRHLPATDLTVIEDIGGQLWFGSANGAFLLQPSAGTAGETFRYFASERWIPGNKVTGIAKGPGNSLLVLTDKGIGKICFQPMNLEQKAMYYEQIVRQRHIRYGFYSDYTGVNKGDASAAVMGPHDSDNLWTSMYLAGELFRYLVTHDEEAKQNYHESFDAMERLFTLSGIPGLFGRCIERSGVVEFKDEIRKNIASYWYPGYDHTPSSWRHSPDKQWDWRGSSSSDQTVGQFFALTLVAQYTDDTALKQRAINLIDQLTGYILDNGLRLIDVDGRPTLWGLWGPEYVNRFPDMVGDKKLYSSNIIAFLQTAYHFTGKEKYKTKALELLYKAHYLKNLTMPVKNIGPAPDTADAWCKELSGGWNNSDDEMYFLAYWGLYPYALDTSLQGQYREAIRDHWNYKRSAKDGLWNLCYGVLTGAKEFDLEPTIWELKKMPLDLIDWSTHNSDRKDLVFIGPNIREQPTRDVLPPDERPQNKHNRNLFDLDDNGGNGGAELGGGDVYLLPYWMGRYFGAISAPIDNQTSSLPE